MKQGFLLAGAAAITFIALLILANYAYLGSRTRSVGAVTAMAVDAAHNRAIDLARIFDAATGDAETDAAGNCTVLAQLAGGYLRAVAASSVLDSNSIAVSGVVSVADGCGLSPPHVNVSLAYTIDAGPAVHLEELLQGQLTP